jgi:hypothetical protein
MTTCGAVAGQLGNEPGRAQTGGSGSDSQERNEQSQKQQERDWSTAAQDGGLLEGPNPKSPGGGMMVDGSQQKGAVLVLPCRDHSFQPAYTY